MPLYVVKRSFKAGGKLFEIGSLVEDLSTVKLAKIRINDGHLVPVPEGEKELAILHKYYKDRIGIDLEARLTEHASKGSDSVEVNPSAQATTPPPGTTKQVIQPQVVKAPPPPNTKG